jgi:predicted Ser/Thr protein kinase
MPSANGGPIPGPGPHRQHSMGPGHAGPGPYGPHHSPTPPGAPTGLTVLWALVPLFTCGIGTPFTIGYAAARRRSVLLGLAAGLYGAGIAIFLIAIGAYDDVDQIPDPLDAITTVGLFGSWIGGTVHSFLIRSSVFGPRTAPYGRAGMPAGHPHGAPYRPTMHQRHTAPQWPGNGPGHGWPHQQQTWQPGTGPAPSRPGEGPRPGRSAPGQPAPGQPAPGQPSPGHSGRGHWGPGHSGQGQSGPPAAAPPVGSHPSDGRPAGSRPGGPHDSAPQHPGLRDSGAQRHAPHDAGPQHHGPHDAGSQHQGLRDSGAQRHTPHDPGPQRPGLRDSGPHQSGPRSVPRASDPGLGGHLGPQDVTPYRPGSPYTGQAQNPQGGGTARSRPGEPRWIGPYRVLDTLGKGGQGAVYLCLSPNGDKVAVKVLHDWFADDETAKNRFLREVDTARRVATFSTARVIDVNISDELAYIVSEFVDGRSLEQLVREKGPRDADGLTRLALATAGALAAIHKAGIVHRDFKPSNVLIGADGPRVIDFGIARALDQVTATSGKVVGTPAYMSPEQLSGDDVGPKSDVFSWAVTMVFAATGRPAFGEDTIPAIFNRVLNHQPDLSALPSALRPLASSCLEKRPENRPTASDVMLAIVH